MEMERSGKRQKTEEGPGEPLEVGSRIWEELTAYFLEPTPPGSASAQAGAQDNGSLLVFPELQSFHEVRPPQGTAHTFCRGARPHPGRTAIPGCPAADARCWGAHPTRS